MARQLQRQVAIVTGAGRGFGRTIAMRFAAEGAAVTVTARTQKQLDAVAAEIAIAGGRALAIVGDVTSQRDVARVVAMTEEHFGPATLLVNNAGVPGPFGPIWAVDWEAWWSAQQVHILAPLLYLRQVMPGMVERRAGRIIIVSAVASRMVAPHLSAYCVGKIAQTRIAAEAAAEARDFGVSVFAIDPGFVFTDIAAETMNSPDAQRWLPAMVARLREKQAEPDKDAALALCAQRCVDLAAGKYDALTGRYLELQDDLDALLRAGVTVPGSTGGSRPGAQ
jgi:NAD(P)-dependent dehydrogenase (short-subunit alcohol dehydrogenase family)